MSNDSAGSPPPSSPPPAPPVQPAAGAVAGPQSVPLPPVPGVQPPHLADAHSKKILCGILAIVFGNLGIHKFLLGYTGAGLITLLLNCTGIGIPVMRIITIIEGIIYLTKTDEDFYNLYIANKRPWF